MAWIAVDLRSKREKCLRNGTWHGRSRNLFVQPVGDQVTGTTKLSVSAPMDAVRGSVVAMSPSH